MVRAPLRGSAAVEARASTVVLELLEGLERRERS
jgi:hypothetical protein